MLYEKCRNILLKEFELIQDAVNIQEKTRQAVTEKEWTAFEENISVMNGIEIKLNDLENEREKLFDVAKTLIHQQNFSDSLDSKGRFYTLVSFLPKDQKEELTSIYRSLKMETVKLRIANESLAVYINGVKNTLREFIDIACIDRGGKMYTKNGKPFSHNVSSFVLNQSF